MKDLKETKTKRTLTQNRALHLFFKHVSIGLNNLGLTFNYTGLKGLELEMPYTEFIVKEMVWKPIQFTMFEIKSTTKLTTLQINTILDILTKFFAERDIEIHFPSKIDLLVKEFEKKGIY